jgi:hypothetical protein
MPSESEPLETWGADDAPDEPVWQNAHYEVLEVVNRWRVHILYRFLSPHILFSYLFSLS